MLEINMLEINARNKYKMRQNKKLKFSAPVLVVNYLTSFRKCHEVSIFGPLSQNIHLSK